MTDIFRLGRHFLIEYGQCDPEVLNQPERIREGMLRAIARSGATLITDVFHQFSPQGVTGVAVIAESHVSVHTWPEHAYAAVDIFTCSEKMNAQFIQDDLRLLFRSQHVSAVEVPRGIRTSAQATPIFFSTSM